jgi:hypothetical protein
MGDLWRSDSKTPYRMAPVNHWLRLIGWSETNKYHPYSSIECNGMHQSPEKTVEPSETANKLLFLGHCWTSQVLMPGLGPKITKLSTCTVQMTWIKLSFQNPKFRPCSFIYHIRNFRTTFGRNSWTANRLPVAPGRFHEAPIASRICCESCWPRKELMTPIESIERMSLPKKYTNWVIGCLNPSNGFMNPSIWHVTIIQYPMVHHHGLGKHSHVWDTVTTFGNCPSSCMVPVINSDFKRDNPKSQIFTCHGIFEAGMQQVSFLWVKKRLKIGKSCYSL